VDDSEILARWLAGETVQGIADRAGLTRQRIAQRVLRAAARSGDDWDQMIATRAARREDRRRTVTADQLRAMLVLHTAGLSQRQIAEIVGVHRATVKKAVEKKLPSDA
jgi:DNA-directed RNA polymerase specialized sigma24 family protein